VSCLRTMKNRLYHMGIRSPVSRNNLAHANEMRGWRIYADFPHVLIAEARTLCRDEDIRPRSICAGRFFLGLLFEKGKGPPNSIPSST